MRKLIFQGKSLRKGSATDSAWSEGGRWREALISDGRFCQMRKLIFQGRSLRKGKARGFWLMTGSASHAMDVLAKCENLYSRGEFEEGKCTRFFLAGGWQITGSAVHAMDVLAKWPLLSSSVGVWGRGGSPFFLIGGWQIGSKPYIYSQIKLFEVPTQMLFCDPTETVLGRRTLSSNLFTINNSKKSVGTDCYVSFAWPKFG